MRLRSTASIFGLRKKYVQEKKSEGHATQRNALTEKTDEKSVFCWFRSSNFPRRFHRRCSLSTPPAPSPNFSPFFSLLLSFLQESRIKVPGAGVVAAQDARDGDGGVELLGEAGAGALGPDARVLILAKEDVAGAGVVVVPDLPPGRVDDARHAGALERDLRVLPPGAAEVEGAVGDLVAVRGVDGAAVEDVVRLVGRGLAAVGCLRTVSLVF